MVAALPHITICVEKCMQTGQDYVPRLGKTMYPDWARLDKTVWKFPSQ
jgi:hypothetical protein